MTWLRTIGREIFGLFVDDGSFALLILAWLGVAVFLLPRVRWLPQGRGFILSSGLALILMGSAVRFCRRKGS